MAQTIKNPPAMQETQVASLSWVDPLEEEMATHSSTLAWRIPWTEDPGEIQSVESQDLDATVQLTHSPPLHLSTRLWVGSILTPLSIQGNWGPEA